MTDNNNNNSNDEGINEKVEIGSKDESSATTNGTAPSITAASGDTTSVTAQALPSVAADSQSTRRRPVTTHRKTRDYIMTDSFQNTRHVVPDSKRPRAAWCPKMIDAVKENVASKSGLDWLELFFPMTTWLKTYSWRENLLQDFIAGCTVGVMVVPQSMSYAKLAGLPVGYGLYSALVPVYAYAVWGSSRQLAVGPVALVSLLLATGLTHELEKTGHTPENTENYQEMYNQLAIQVSLLVGCMYIGLGLLR